MEEFETCIGKDAERRKRIAELTSAQHLDLYRGMTRNRLFDTMLKRWTRQGVLSKAWLGTGEEAVTIGAVHALRKGDVVGPMIRNAGAYHEMGVSLADMFKTYLGTKDSPTGGKDLHLGSMEHGIVAPISMVGSLVPVCAGIALAFKVRGRDHVALSWAGDGTTRTTDFHEGLMSACTLKVPLIVVIQDNQIAMGTTHSVHSSAPLEDSAAIYGLPSTVCDGNNVLDVHAAVTLAAEKCREGGGPVILNANTFRMGGHATHDEGDSRDILPLELFEHWGRRDPVAMYEAYLISADFRLSDDATNLEVLEQVEAEVTAEVETAADEALARRGRNMPSPGEQSLGVYESP
jgi:2-oxoisovalerate dehydrogenase E1 component